VRVDPPTATHARDTPLEEGVDIKTVSERLGHDTVQTTLELYAHVTPKMRASAAARFGSLLSRARLTPAAEAAGS
jgi:integrase